MVVITSYVQVRVELAFLGEGGKRLILGDHLNKK